MICIWLHPTFQISLENLPSPPKIPPSRATAVVNRVNQFNQWSDLSKVLATDSYLEVFRSFLITRAFVFVLLKNHILFWVFLNIDYFQDCGSSPMRRSALRDVSQCANKSVTIREEENNYFSPHSSLQSNRYSPMKRPPPPYEQLNYIRHGNKGNNDNMVVVGNSTQDIFYDAETSLCQGKRKVTFKERRNRS